MDEARVQAVLAEVARRGLDTDRVYDLAGKLYRYKHGVTYSSEVDTGGAGASIVGATGSNGRVLAMDGRTVPVRLRTGEVAESSAQGASGGVGSPARAAADGSGAGSSLSGAALRATGAPGVGAASGEHRPGAHGARSGQLERREDSLPTGASVQPGEHLSGQARAALLSRVRETQGPALRATAARLDLSEEEVIDLAVRVYRFKHGWIPLTHEAAMRIKKGPKYKDPGTHTPLSKSRPSSARPKQRHDAAGHAQETIARGSNRSKQLGRRPATEKGGGDRLTPEEMEAKYSQRGARNRSGYAQAESDREKARQAAALDVQRMKKADLEYEMKQPNEARRAAARAEMERRVNKRAGKAAPAAPEYGKPGTLPPGYTVKRDTIEPAPGLTMRGNSFSAYDAQGNRVHQAAKSHTEAARYARKHHERTTAAEAESKARRDAMAAEKAKKDAEAAAFHERMQKPLPKETTDHAEAARIGSMTVAIDHKSQHMISNPEKLREVANSPYASAEHKAKAKAYLDKISYDVMSSRMSSSSDAQLRELLPKIDGLGAPQDEVDAAKKYIAERLGKGGPAEAGALSPRAQQAQNTTDSLAKLVPAGHNIAYSESPSAMHRLYDETGDRYGAIVNYGHPDGRLNVRYKGAPIGEADTVAEGAKMLSDKHAQVREQERVAAEKKANARLLKERKNARIQAAVVAELAKQGAPVQFQPHTFQHDGTKLGRAAADKIQQSYKLGNHTVHIEHTMNQSQTVGLLSDIGHVIQATDLHDREITFHVPTGDKAFRKKRNGAMTGGYVRSGGGRTVYINPSVADGGEGAQRFHDTAHGDSGHFMPGAVNTSGRRYVITHEVGHVLDGYHRHTSAPDSLTPSGFTLMGGRSEAASRLFKQWRSQLSQYGRSNPAEAYAEAYSQWVHGGPGSSPAADAYAKEFGWRVPKK